jgi:hypothetical protein
MTIEVEELRRIKLKRGEVLVVTLPESSTEQEIVNTLTEWLGEAFPNNKVMVIHPSTKVDVYSPEDAPE